MESFESPGEWWLPDHPDRRIAGVLRVTPNGVRVALFSTLSEDASEFGETARYAAVFGSVHESPFSGGTEVSLFDTFAASRSLRSNGTTSETIVANGAYIGDRHVPSTAVGYSQYTVTFAGLAEWLTASALDRSVVNGRIRVETREVVRQEASLPGATLEFVTSAQFQYSNDEYIFRDLKTAHFRTEEPQTHDFMSRAFLVPFRNFLSLATGASSEVESCSIVLADGEPWPEVVHDLRLWERQQRPKRPDRSGLLDAPIPVPEGRGLEDLLTRWWKLTNEHRRVFDLVFALLQEPPRFVEVKFMNAMLAIDLIAERFAGGDIARLVGQLGPETCGQLGSAEQVTERLHGARDKMWSRDPAESSELIKINGVLLPLLRLALINELGASLAPSVKSGAFRHYAQRFRSV